VALAQLGDDAVAMLEVALPFSVVYKHLAVPALTYMAHVRTHMNVYTYIYTDTYVYYDDGAVLGNNRVAFAQLGDDGVAMLQVALPFSVVHEHLAVPALIENFIELITSDRKLKASRDGSK